MRLFDYECSRCGEWTEHLVVSAKTPKTFRCSCGGRAEWRPSAPAIHTLASFSANIDDEQVRATRNPGDGSYLDPTLSFDWENNSGVVTPITSEKQRSRLMQEKGLFEKEPTDKAKDVARLKRTRPIHFTPAAKAAQGGSRNA